VALRSICEQDAGAPFEVIVVDDASADATPDVARRHGARTLRLRSRSGPNAGRNAGAAAARADLIAYVDDDVRAGQGWLRALVEGAERHPDALVYGGPIRASLEGPAPHGCGREPPPITTLDLGPGDRPADLVWSANMMVRRRAIELAGPFDESMGVGGDEEEWLERLKARGGGIVYLAAAGLDHRRRGDDARLRSLARAAYRRGRAMRSFDERRGRQPDLARELRVLAGCGWHTVRRRCPSGLVMGAHSLGRAVESVAR
jgi:glycosyltransferase involved in cell wall biosynthesis